MDPDFVLGFGRDVDPDTVGSVSFCPPGSRFISLIRIQIRIRVSIISAKSTGNSHENHQNIIFFKTIVYSHKQEVHTEHNN